MVFEISYYRKCALFLTCDNSRIGFFIKVFVDTVFRRPYRYMNIFFIVGRIKHWKSQCGKMQILLCKHSINNVTNLHNFETTGISINYYNSPRTVSVKVLTLPVVTEQTLPAIRDLKHLTIMRQKVHVAVPIRSCYTTWLPSRTILFCMHMIFAQTIHCQ